MIVTSYRLEPCEPSSASCDPSQIARRRCRRYEITSRHRRPDIRDVVTSGIMGEEMKRRATSKMMQARRFQRDNETQLYSFHLWGLANEATLALTAVPKYPQEFFQQLG